jgi:hypothetical protein
MFQRLVTVGGARRSVNAAHLTATLNGYLWLWDEGGSAIDSYCNVRCARVHIVVSELCRECQS